MLTIWLAWVTTLGIAIAAPLILVTAWPSPLARAWTSAWAMTALWMLLNLWLAQYWKSRANEWEIAYWRDTEDCLGRLQQRQGPLGQPSTSQAPKDAYAELQRLIDQFDRSRLDIHYGLAECFPAPRKNIADISADDLSSLSVQSYLALSRPDRFGIPRDQTSSPLISAGPSDNFNNKAGPTPCDWCW